MQTLDVSRQHQTDFSIHVLAFCENVKLAVPLLKELKPMKAVVLDNELKQLLKAEV